jgi:hypothetical protein
VSLAVTAAVFVPAIAFDARLLREPSSARLPAIDRWQYVEGWPSGYGWRESHELLAREEDESGRPLRVVTERLHWTLKAYFIGDPNVTVKGFDFDDPTWAEKAGTWVGSGQGWLVTSGPSPPDPPPGFALRPAAAFTKPGGGMTVTVYRLEAETPRP